VRKQVLALEAKVTALLPCYTDRFQLGGPLLISDPPTLRTSEAGGLGG
jgi:hypothetical protein